MKAMVQDRFGPPDTLKPADVDRPEPGTGQVLVRVYAASVNPYDWHMLRGDPYAARLTGGVGLTRPKCRVAGIDAAGRVEATGPGVDGLRPGDEVLGFCPGAFAEYAVTAADLLVPKPANLTFAQAAAVPMGAVTALRGIRTVGGVRAGQRVLINGAGGGVGTFAVQLAAAADAEVTAVCGTRNTGLVRSLGAAHVIDYTREDFTASGPRYDVVLDNVGNRPTRLLRRVLTPTGTLVANGGGSPGHVFGPMASMPRLMATGLFTRHRLRVILPAAPSGPTHKDLLTVTSLIASGHLTPVTGRTYPLREAGAALREVEGGHARGKIVLTVG
ncbi:NAD(P)-dependent alcohol dehydrogenase [Streptomyces sp. NPDC087226]|uniref:NAD(P)-dependent alcohol dehydrogenase n=1 Tax=Streptomyces sp. NPDC087226 TaxID=3365771 RepID=UPI00381C2D49